MSRVIFVQELPSESSSALAEVDKIMSEPLDLSSEVDEEPECMNVVGNISHRLAPLVPGMFRGVFRGVF